jgi:lysine 2,3-aminomutase
VPHATAQFDHGRGIEHDRLAVAGGDEQVTAPMKKNFRLDIKDLVCELWRADPEIHGILSRAKAFPEARDKTFAYLNDLERHYFNIYSSKRLMAVHIIERDNAKECIRVLKNVIRTENEALTGFSALKQLYLLARNPAHVLPSIHRGFLFECLYLFKGINAHSEITARFFPKIQPEVALSPLRHSAHLDKYAERLDRATSRFSTSRNPAARLRQDGLRKAILRFFGAADAAWHDYRWHLRHVITDRATLSRLIKLEPDEIEGLTQAAADSIPFQVTPYYLSLFSRNGRTDFDRGIRAQVLPSALYCRIVTENRRKGTDMDFMGEKVTSPVPAITRRYPQIVILKPFDACPQICVYCQRNWEITGLEKSAVSRATVGRALGWIRSNKHLREVLITGGDPLTLDNAYLEWLLQELSDMRHIKRIRIGTRVFVTLPCRIENGFLRILKKYHRWGVQEIALVTHVEYGAEITDNFVGAVSRVRNAGLNIYNQQVFTYYNSRRYETCFLRAQLKQSGVDPYYTFNTKGKAETQDFRVPIARIEQEYKEEARLLPGLVRMDQPVFNVPLQGKSNLVAWQDHEPIMILADGSRVYRFYPWESRFSFTDDYLYTDVPIYDYLKRLHGDGENLDDYRSIWYYF